MNQRKIRDFMSIDTFSQLPLIRPAPPSRDGTPAGAIRLFGIEFAGESSETEEERCDRSKDNNNPNGACTSGSGATTAHRGGSGPCGVDGGGRDAGGRKFECHYCGRNFPTPQALGGHQNAHKRERQHARSAHLQSTMAGHQHALGGGAAEGRVYSSMSYHRLGSMVAGRVLDFLPPPHRSPWPGTVKLAGLSPFHGGPGSVSQPLNGDPLPGLWRMTIPSAQGGGGAGLHLVQGDRAAARPSSLGVDGRRPGRQMEGTAAVGGRWGGKIPGLPPPAPPLTGRLLHGSASGGVQEQLSLDLHL